jgi:hypothetical protein
MLRTCSATTHSIFVCSETYCVHPACSSGVCDSRLGPAHCLAALAWWRLIGWVGVSLQGLCICPYPSGMEWVSGHYGACVAHELWSRVGAPFRCLMQGKRGVHEPTLLARETTRGLPLCSPFRRNKQSILLLVRQQTPFSLARRPAHLPGIHTQSPPWRLRERQCVSTPCTLGPQIQIHICGL